MTIGCVEKAIHLVICYIYSVIDICNVIDIYRGDKSHKHNVKEFEIHFFVMNCWLYIINTSAFKVQDDGHTASTKRS